MFIVKHTGCPYKDAETRVLKYCLLVLGKSLSWVIFYILV